MKKVLLILCLVLLICGCGKKDTVTEFEIEEFVETYSLDDGRDITMKMQIQDTARYPVYWGKEENGTVVTTDEIAYYETDFVINNIEVVVSGDLTAEEKKVIADFKQVLINRDHNNTGFDYSSLNSIEGKLASLYNDLIIYHMFGHGYMPEHPGPFIKTKK